MARFHDSATFAAESHSVPSMSKIIPFFILLLFIPAEFFVSEKQLNTGGASPLPYEEWMG